MYYEELCAAGEKLTGLGGDFEIIETGVRGVIQTFPFSIPDIHRKK